MVKTIKIVVGLCGVWGLICGILASLYGRGTAANIFGFTWLGLWGVAGSLAVVSYVLECE